MTKKPIIAITADLEDDGKYSASPYFAIRENYISAISKYGAVPLIIPYSLENIEEYLNIIDGFIISGGYFDIDPSLYGDSTKHQSVSTKDERTKFEFK